MRSDLSSPNTKSSLNSNNNRGFVDRKVLSGGGTSHSFNNIISIENLLVAWKEFIHDKKKKPDVAEFSLNLSKNIFRLHFDLKNKTYQHSNYTAFKINDPKTRDIHKAVVRDRLLHHAVYRILYPYFDKKFIYDSYSCRLAKGTHKAIARFISFGRKVSKNNTKTCFILKCDIRKFFANIDHRILKQILVRHITDTDTLNLLSNVIDSFKTGLPLGNLTSQLLVNVYMNEFDQYMKHELKVKYYIRYADDFAILSDNKEYLIDLLNKISSFLNNKLKLQLHPDKVYIKTLASGIDFLGWVHFPYHMVLRTSTKRRMLKKIRESDVKEEVLASYLGMLWHGNGYKLEEKIKNNFISNKIQK